MGPKLSIFACLESSQGELHLSYPYHIQLLACPTLQHWTMVAHLPMARVAPLPSWHSGILGKEAKGPWLSSLWVFILTHGLLTLHSASAWSLRFFSEQAGCVVLTWGRDFVFHLSKLVLRAFRIHPCKQTKRSTTPKNLLRKYLRAS